MWFCYFFVWVLERVLMDRIKIMFLEFKFRIEFLILSSLGLGVILVLVVFRLVFVLILFCVVDKVFEM